jgi:hypothetical protein
VSRLLLTEWKKVLIVFTAILKVSKKKGKMIPLHAMEAHGVKGGTAPTHS